MGVYAAFADLLEYPDESLARRADACDACWKQCRASEEPRAWLRQFRAFAATTAAARLQEIYTQAFDLDAECTLDAGHHLFGHDTRRNLFLARLAGMYLASGFERATADAADALPVILRFVDGEIAPSDRDDLLADAVAPAAARIARALDDRQHPYAPVLHALLAVIEACAPAAAPHTKATV